MEVITCRSCGRLFNYIHGPRVCQGCVQKLEEKFTEVKKFVRENPSVGIRELSEEMKVSVAQINRWVREERLVFSEDSPIGIPCESCGATIRTGRFCNACKANLTTGLRDAAGLNKKEAPAAKRHTATTNRMRFLDNNQN